jgi:alpha-L-arabinofuranosidase
VIDRSLQLIACGSSNTILPTYLVWDREVLEECYDQVDGISLHNYYGNTTQLTGGSTARYLAMNLDMERQIHEIAAVCDYVQGVLRSPKRLWLSFDEWNVWYRARGGRFANGNSLHDCSRRSTTLRTHCWWEASSIRCCARLSGFGWVVSRRSSTPLRRW